MSAFGFDVDRLFQNQLHDVSEEVTIFQLSPFGFSSSPPECEHVTVHVEMFISLVGPAQVVHVSGCLKNMFCFRVYWQLAMCNHREKTVENGMETSLNLRENCGATGPGRRFFIVFCASKTTFCRHTMFTPFSRKLSRILHGTLHKDFIMHLVGKRIVLTNNRIWKSRLFHPAAGPS